MPSTVRLRVATIDDAALLAELGARLFAQTFGAANTPEDMEAYLAGAFSPETQAAELAEPDRMTWIAEDAAGVPIGYVVLIRNAGVDSVVAERPAELRRIYVDLSATPQGVIPRSNATKDPSVAEEETSSPRREGVLRLRSATPQDDAVDTGSPKPGALLMNRCIQQAREWGCDVIWLAVWEENPRAIRFYEKNGFQKVGVKDFRLGSDVQHDFVMARNL